MKTNREMVEWLKKAGYIKSKEVERAFLAIDRRVFVPERYREFAYKETALPIADGATISSPIVVATIIEEAKIKPGDKILEIGSGSGYSTALIQFLAKPEQIISLEISKEVAEIAKRNLEKVKDILGTMPRVLVRDGKLGYEEKKPYDKIIIHAAVKRIEKPWLEQLKEKGEIICPLYISPYEQKLVKIDKQGKIKESLLDVVFVELK